MLHDRSMIAREGQDVSLDFCIIQIEIEASVGAGTNYFDETLTTGVRAIGVTVI